MPWEAQTLEKSGRTYIMPDASALWEGFCLKVCSVKWFRYPSESNMPVIHPVWKNIQPLTFDFSISHWLEITKVISLPFGIISHSPTNKKEGGLWKPNSGVCKVWGEKLQETVAALYKVLFFFYKFIYLFIYLLEALGFRCGAQASHCSGFSCCGARALGARASVVVTHRL